MENQVKLSVEESLKFAQEQAYWDGYAAGAAATAAHAKQLLVRSAVARNQAAPQPKAEE